MNQILTGGVEQNVTGASRLSGEITSSDLSNSAISKNKKDMAKALKNLETPQDNNGKGKNREKNTGRMVERYESFIRRIEGQKNRAKIRSIKSAIKDLLQEYINYAPGLSNEKLRNLEATILSSVIGLVDSQRHVVSGLPNGYVDAEVSNEIKSIVDPNQLAIQDAVLGLAMEFGPLLPEVKDLVVELIRADFNISKDNVEAIAAIEGYFADASQLLVATTTTADANSPLKGIPR